MSDPILWNSSESVDWNSSEEILWNSGASPHPVGRLTQLRPQHATGRRYGSFAGRGSGPHLVGRITQLHPQHATGKRYGSFAGRGSSAVVVPPTPSREQPAGRRRYRIIARVNGELIEIESVEELFRLLHRVKHDIPQVAKEKAIEMLRTGKRISEERKTRTIEIIRAPARAKSVIAQRLDEMDRYYWALVGKAIERLEDDDEEVILMTIH